MTVDESRLAELRRIAFGRTRSAEEEVAAAFARIELDAALATPVDPVSPVIAQPVTPPPSRAISAEAEAETEAETAATAGAVPVPRARLALPLVAAIALTVGALVGAGGLAAAQSGAMTPVAPATPTSTFTPGSSERPPDIDALRAGMAAGPGDVEAAASRFDGKQLPTDEYPFSDGLRDGMHIDPDSTRLAAQDPRGRVWIARGDDESFCLLQLLESENGTGSGYSACTPAGTFAAEGLELLADSTFLVTWNGERIITSTTGR